MEIAIAMATKAPRYLIQAPTVSLWVLHSAKIIKMSRIVLLEDWHSSRTDIQTDWLVISVTTFRLQFPRTS
jgi:hypothetical protein